MLISNIEEEIKCPICKEYISENIRKTACDHLFCDKCYELYGYSASEQRWWKPGGYFYSYYLSVTSDDGIINSLIDEECEERDYDQLEKMLTKMIELYLSN